MSQLWVPYVAVKTRFILPYNFVAFHPTHFNSLQNRYVAQAMRPSRFAYISSGCRPRANIFSFNFQLAVRDGSLIQFDANLR